MVNSPKHYNTGKIEVADFINDQGLDFFAGNTIKYICRYKHKNKPIEDLEKAQWYLNRLLKIIKEKK